MTLNENNATAARSVLSAISDLEAGKRTPAEVKVLLQSAIHRLENDGSGVVEAIRLAEADLEEIQFTLLSRDQVSAAIVRLDKLRDVIGAAAWLGDI